MREVGREVPCPCRSGGAGINTANDEKWGIATIVSLITPQTTGIHRASTSSAYDFPGPRFALGADYTI